MIDSYNYQIVSILIKIKLAMILQCIIAHIKCQNKGKTMLYQTTFLLVKVLFYDSIFLILKNALTVPLSTKIKHYK